MVEVGLYSRIVLTLRDLVEKKLLYEDKEEVLDKEYNCDCKPGWLRIKWDAIHMMLVFIEIDEGKVEIMDWEEQDSAVNRVGYGQNLHGSCFKSLLFGENEDSQENKKDMSKEIESDQIPGRMNNEFER